MDIHPWNRKGPSDPARARSQGLLPEDGLSELPGMRHCWDRRGAPPYGPPCSIPGTGRAPSDPARARSQGLLPEDGLSELPGTRHGLDRRGVHCTPIWTSIPGTRRAHLTLLELGARASCLRTV
ncbi:hypothetical protein NDU88_011722 [Pleurodeles waltl]|uniref:Uncharacterized protein n=1 Tax=Pleurodeles waltl TaxID=8319 RepID=A0AAV7S522_PLEWA|nr:hypothetical protein NDU88_011722 [Pleurodeles waltl]